MKLRILSIIALLWAVTACMEAVSISCSPNPQVKPQGQAFTLTVDLDTTTQIRGYSIRLQYDPTVLSFSQASRGTLFNGQNVGWWRSINESAGVYRIECIIFGYELFVTGPGNLINLTFNSLSQGYSAISFPSIELYDPTGAIIPDVTATPGVVLIGSGITYTSARAYLQGPFSNGSMATNIKQILPLNSPYPQAPYTVTAMLDDTVDWVLLELRASPTGQAIRYLPAILHSNGLITSPGKPFIIIENSLPQSVYMVIRHRNHLPVMSADPIHFLSTGNPAIYDYSQIINVYGQGGISRVAPGVYAMTAGDANMDGGVYPADKNLYWKLQSGQSGYRSADFNLDGYVLPGDLNSCWRVNSGKACTVPASNGIAPRMNDD